MKPKPASPIVSIIIPSFNKDNLILKTLYSIFANDYQGPLEVIVIDDHSTDKMTLLAYEEAKQKFPIILEENPGKGPADARNFGLNLSCGEYIIFVDSDDIISPNFISKSLEVISHQGPKIAYVYPDIITFNKHLGLRKTPDFSKNRLEIYNYVPVTCLYRRKSLEEVFGFKNDLWAMEDWDLFLRLLKRGYIGKKIPSANNVYLLYRMISGQGVNASAFQPFKRIVLRSEILSRNGFNTAFSWLWNCIAVFYGSMQSVFSYKERTAFQTLPQKVKENILGWAT